MNDMVLGLMAVTGGVVFLGEGYVNNYAAWVVDKTSGKNYSQVTPTTGFPEWAFGLVVVTGALVLLADANPTLASVFAGLIALTAGFKLGPQAVTNARALVGIGNQSGVSEP